MDVPSTEDLASYILKFLEGIDKGAHPLTEGALAGASSSLKNLQTRLETLIELEGYQTGSSLQDAEYFSSKLLEKLALEKEVIVPSGYNQSPAGHRVYFRFLIEEREGKQWVSGSAVNLGEGTKKALFLDEQGRARVDPEQLLNPVPLEKLSQDLFFWKAFLELRSFVREDGKSTEWSIKDFNHALLSHWPGGVGSYSQKSKKPQYSGTCQFAPLKHIITEMFDSKEHKTSFLLSLYEKILVDYVSESGVTKENVSALKETCAHLARRISKSLLGNEALATSISEKIGEIERAIQVFEANQGLVVLKSRVNIRERVHGSYRDEFLVDLPQREQQLPVLNPPGNLLSRLQFYFTNIKERGSQDKICIARRVLEELPSIDDPIWESGEKNDIFLYLSNISSEFRQQMAEEVSSSELPIQIGSNDAALLFKSYIVQFKMCAALIGDQSLVDFFLSRMKGVLESGSMNLLRPTHPGALSHFSESVEYMLQKGRFLSAADNQSLMEIKVRDCTEIKHYPHLNFLYRVLQTNGILKERVLEELRKGDPKRATFSDLDCIMFLYKERYITSDKHNDNSDVIKFSKLIQVWEKFFTLFGVCCQGKDNSGWSNANFNVFAFWKKEDAAFQEQVSDVFNSNHPGTKEFLNYFSSKEVSQACQENLFLATYPGFEKKDAQALLPILNKEQPFEKREKGHENAHLLQTEGLEVGEERLPFYEVQNLLSLTTYKDLSIDLIVKYFDRFFPRLKSKTFQTLFHTLLTQTFLEKDNTHNLLSFGVEHHREQVFQLLDFIKRRRGDALNYRWHETVVHLFWVEGLVLSYLMRGKGLGDQEESAYQNYLDQIRCFFEREGGKISEKFQDLPARLISLAPYFEKTAQQASFFSFIRRYIREASSSDAMPREEKRALDHGFQVFQGALSRGDNGGSFRTVTVPFQGRYQWFPKATFSTFVNGPEFSEMRYYASEDRNHGLFFKKGEEHPRYLYRPATLFARGSLERLEEGVLTGLKLSSSSYRPEVPIYTILSRLASESHLYLWKDAAGNLARADIGGCNLSFSYKREGNSTRGLWMSSRHPGYYLDPCDRFPLFEPSSHYITLRNQKG